MRYGFVFEQHAFLIDGAPFSMNGTPYTLGLEDGQEIVAFTRR